ncbi:MAG TPA: ABC transporter permease [Longimicrobiales bacterium]|nr:ABC transporter permease [Longimicrobiales bacterium]
MTGFAQDLRYALRMLVKSPWTSGLSVGALALGIGVTATMFCIVYGAIMRGLPFAGGDRIMAVTSVLRDQTRPTSVHDYVDLRGQQRSFETLEAFYQGTVNVSWADRPERFEGAFVSANAFGALGVLPVLGRPFREDEARPGAPLVLMLSHHVWRERFAGSPEALGQVVKVNGEQAEIVGVMPEGFLFPERQDVWVPLRLDPLTLPRGEGTGLQVYGLLRRGVTPEAARADLGGIASRLAAEYPETNDGLGVDVRPFHEQFIGDQARALLLSMLGAVSLVLLIACANVANLLLARAAVRMREVGIRTALGASRRRVVSQMVAEALVLALLGGALGAGLAWVGIELFEGAIADTDPPFFLVFRLDAPILLFILAVSVGSAFVAGGIPAFKASGLDVGRILKDESRGSSSLHIGRLSRFLVVGEVAMSMGLLVAAGLMVKSVVTLRDYDFGFDGERVFTARVGLFESEFPTPVDRERFYEQLRVRLAQVPGVAASSLGTVLPGLGSPSMRFSVEGVAYPEERDRPTAFQGQVAPGYFRTVGVEPTLGRDFEISDDRDAVPVAIVNASFAQKHFPGGSPLGRRFRVGSDRDADRLTVVGVVPDLWMQGAGDMESPPDGFYTPVAQGDARFMSLLARGPGDPMALTAGVREAVMAVHADTPIYFVDTLAGRVAQNTWVYNVFGVLFMVFGGVALFLASVGLYGVMAFSVSRRTSEVGIRMALGAEARQVLALVLRQGLAQTALGLALGLGLALLLSRALRLVLFQVDAADPTVFLTVSLVLVGTGVLASSLPARRATRVDPVVALRGD